MTLIDYAVLLVCGLSALIGVLRGLVREVIALVAWVVAFVVAGAYGGTAAPLFDKFMQDEGSRVMAAMVAVFFMTLVAMSLLALFVSRLVKRAGLGAEDRVLGGIFGLARGLLVVLALVVIAGFTPLPRQTLWKNAMLAAPLEKLAGVVKQWLPPGWAKFITFE